MQAMNNSSVKKFVIDGFPRNEDNLSGYNKRMEGKADVKCVLFFDCPEEVNLLLVQCSLISVTIYITATFYVPVPANCPDFIGTVLILSGQSRFFTFRTSKNCNFPIF